MAKANLNRVVTRYSPKNPVYSDIINNFIEAGLYTDDLDNGPAVDTNNTGHILTYKNGSGKENSAVPLEVLTDGISKGILKQLRDGLNESVDTALNLNYSPKTSSNLYFKDVDNIHSAITRLSNEVAELHKALAIVLGATGNGGYVATMETAITTLNAEDTSSTIGKKITLD